MRSKPPPLIPGTVGYWKRMEYLKKCKQLNAARRAERSTPRPAPEARLDATPVRLSAPQKMPHLRRACDEDEE